MYKLPVYSPDIGFMARAEIWINCTSVLHQLHLHEQTIWSYKSSAKYLFA